MFPPRPYRIVKFVYHKIMQKWTNKEPTITESYAIRGYEVYEENGVMLSVRGIEIMILS